MQHPLAEEGGELPLIDISNIAKAFQPLITAGTGGRQDHHHADPGRSGPPSPAFSLIDPDSREWRDYLAFQKCDKEFSLHNPYLVREGEHVFELARNVRSHAHPLAKKVDQQDESGLRIDYLELRSRQNKSWALDVVKEGIEVAIQGGSSKAVHHFTKAIQISPDCLEAYIERCLWKVYLTMKELERAKRDRQRITELVANTSPAREALDKDLFLKVKLKNIDKDLADHQRKKYEFVLPAAISELSVASPPTAATPSSAKKSPTKRGRRERDKRVSKSGLSSDENNSQNEGEESHRQRRQRRRRREQRDGDHRTGTSPREHSHSKNKGSSSRGHKGKSRHYYHHHNP